MSAFQKAAALLEDFALERGCYPSEIALTRYPSAAIFSVHKPGENYGDHLSQRAQFVAYAEARGIKIIDDDVRSPVPQRPAALAEQALRKRAGFRKGDPYRLGLKIGTSFIEQVSYSAIGWATITLGDTESGEA